MTDVESKLPEPPIKEPEPPSEAKSEPAKPKTSSLEDELAALLAGTAEIADGAKDAAKTASRVRRKSKEINASCEGMWESSQNKSGAADLWRMLGRSRRNSRDDPADLSDEALRKARECLHSYQISCCCARSLERSLLRDRLARRDMSAPLCTQGSVAAARLPMTPFASRRSFPLLATGSRSTRSTSTTAAPSTRTRCGRPYTRPIPMLPTKWSKTCGSLPTTSACLPLQRTMGCGVPLLLPRFLLFSRLLSAPCFSFVPPTSPLCLPSPPCSRLLAPRPSSSVRLNGTGWHVRRLTFRVVIRSQWFRRDHF